MVYSRATMAHGLIEFLRGDVKLQNAVMPFCSNIFHMISCEKNEIEKIHQNKDRFC
jgi:hypothetical protein